MAVISVSIYGMHFEMKQNDQITILSTKDLNGITQKEFIRNFLESNKGSFVKSSDKVFAVEFLEEGHGCNEQGYYCFDYVAGIIRSGEYGYSADIVDPDSQKISYRKKANEAEAKPFYFMFCFPRTEGNKVLVALQNLGQASIKGVLEKRLKTYLKGNVEQKIEVIIGNLAKQKYIEEYIKKGEIDKIILTKYSKYEDLADQIIGQNLQCQKSDYVIYKPVQIGLKEKFFRLLRGNADIRGVIEIPGQKFDYDDLKIEVKNGKNTKTIDFSDFHRFSIRENVEDRIQIIDGHPVPESIKTVCVEILIEYLEELGV